VQGETKVGFRLLKSGIKAIWGLSASIFEGGEYPLPSWSSVWSEVTPSMSDILENCMEPRLVKPVPKTGCIRFIGEKEGTPAAPKPVELSYPS
jgi:hypothetical protein